MKPTMDGDVVYTTPAAKVRVAEAAERQCGRVGRAQLRRCGATDGTIAQWIVEGYLHRVLPGVYAVGHRSGPIDADLAAALLYAGPGAMLSHATAVWWRKLTARQPAVLEVSTPRRCRSVTGVEVHGRRHLDRIWHNGLTVTTVPQTLLDYASGAPLGDVRYALAEADYQRVLDMKQAAAICGRGKPGSAKLAAALAVHWPDLARTRSKLERDFLYLVEAAGLPRPLINVRVCGFRVDCYWPEQRVVVELDGVQGHSTPAQVARDHGRDLKLRAARIVVRRYGSQQVRHEGEMLLADLRSIL